MDRLEAFIHHEDNTYIEFAEFINGRESFYMDGIC